MTVSPSCRLAKVSPPLVERLRSSAPFFLILLYIGASSLYAPELLNRSSLISILQASAVLLPSVLGMQALIIAGRFDLSIGSIAAMSGIITGVVLLKTSSVPIAVLVGLLAGASAGLLNGLLAAYLGIDGLIVTLSMMGITRSFALGIVSGQTVSGFPDNFQTLAHGNIAGINVVILGSLAALILCEFLFRYNIPCRRLYAIGSNAIAARSAGIPVQYLSIFAFVIAALGASIAGQIQAARAMAASPLVFQDLPLDAIAACVIGGGSLRGGRGTMVGAFLGLLVVVAIRNLVIVLEGSVYWRYLVIGCLILIVSVPDALARRTSNVR